MFFIRLTLIIFPKDNHKAFLSAIFFSFNPSAIFYCANYSESLFSFLTLGGALIYF